jgi:carbon monoxide dehydrogenase subunit G
MSRSEPSHVDVTGRYRIAAGIDDTWRELNNPDALAYSIRQCRHMERVSPNRFRAEFGIGIGPLKVSVGADLNVIPESPPHRYRLSCALAMKLLGKAAGETEINLVEDGDGVVLNYSGRVSASGRIAGYGIEYLHGTVERNVDSFFTRFAQWMEQESASHGPDRDAPNNSTENGDTSL